MTEVLDLFSGLGGFSAAFEEDPAYNVTTVDIEAEFRPDIVADVLELTWQDLPDADILLASPPCTAFTVLSIGHHWAVRGGEKYKPKTDFARTSIQLVHHTIGLIEAIDPEWWVMENPRGMLRKKYRMPDYPIWYCQFGHDSAKPTDLWGRLPPSFEPKTCSNDNPFCDHERAPAGSRSGIQGMLTGAERALVPYGLSEAIKDSIEHPEPKQMTLV
jgi:hypothetical protein